MRRGRWPTLLGAGAVWASALALLGPAPSALAVAPEATGWWWPFEDGRKETPSPSQSQIPAGSLYVAAFPEREPVPGESKPRETAVSALRLRVPDDTAVTELVLTIDTSKTSTNTPIAVQACPTNAAWPAEDAGPIANAPPADCSTGFTFGAIDGDKMRFSIGGLVRDGYLNVVLMPQGLTTTATTPYNVPQPPSDPRFPPPPPTYPTTIPYSQTATTPATTAPFEVVFKKPDAASISVKTYPAGPTGGSEEEESENPFFDEQFAASLGIDPLPANSDFVVPLPSVVTPTPPARGPSRRIPVRSLPPASTIAQNEARDPKALMALVATGLVLLYLGLLGGSGPLRRLPGPFGRVLPEPEGDGPRGIGRFVRPRSRPPLRL